MKIELSVGILAITAALVLQGHAQNLLVNGSFENPVIPTNTSSFTVPSGWSWDDPPGGIFIVNGNMEDPSFPLPEDGNQYVDIGAGVGPSPISQTFNVPVTGQYTLTWFDNGYGPSEYAYTVSVNGNRIGLFDDISYGQWTSFSLSLLLNAGTNTLEFKSSDPGYGDTMIDNVSLVAQTIDLTISSLGADGLNIISSGSGFGSSQKAFQCVLQSTLDFIKWTPISTNEFNTSSFTFTNVVQVTNPATFYRVEATAL